MNIIREQGEDIIQNNNTAQKQLLNILESLSPRIDSIIIQEPLYGDIDLSVIKDNFHLVKKIIFAEGQITSISNIPEGIEFFEISKNLIFSIEDLPSSLIHLNVSYNYLSTIDVSNLSKLKILNISHNQITNIENISNKIEEIHCEFNKIQYLNLQGLDVLKKLNISNNTITVIENLPENIVEFTMENTPSIEFRNSVGDIPINKDNGEDLDNIRKNNNYIESLNDYFRIKQQYQAKLHGMKKKAYESEKNKRLAKRKAMNVKAKCIHCKRAVGTIFANRKNRYIAICGDTISPCKLNIEIFNGSCTNLYYTLDIFNTDIDELKDNIIRQKLDTLFNYVTEEESIKLSKKQLKVFNEDSILYKELLDRYNSLYNNNETRELIAKKSEKIYTLLENSNSLINEYKKTGNDEFLKMAMQIQVNEIKPEIRNMRMLKNEVMEMTDDGVLFTYPVLLSKIVYNVGEPERVINFMR